MAVSLVKLFTAISASFHRILPRILAANSRKSPKKSPLSLPNKVRLPNMVMDANDSFLKMIV